MVKIGKVYRIENIETHDGPYKGAHSGDWYHNNWSANRPVWAIDSRSDVEINGRTFGFSTLKQARAWFDRDDARQLDQLNFGVFRYFGTDLEKAAHQTIFNKLAIPPKLLGKVVDILHPNL